MRRSNMTSPINQPARGESKVYGFMHIATHGPWKEVVREQLELIRSSGLHERMTRLFIGIVGPESGPFEAPDPKIEIIHRSESLDRYEFPTLEYLHAFCKSHEGLVFYVHTKGVFRCNEGTTDWRRYMEYFIIERHADCIRALQSRPVCGVNWQEVPWPHFSGNFWWARSEYLAALPPIEAQSVEVEDWDVTTRHKCERWIASGEPVRPASLHQTHLDHYLSRFRREMYTGPAVAAGARPPRVAVIFDNLVRRDTTGVYCERALWQLAEVSHYLPFETAWIPPGYFDLFLFIDDGLDYEIPADLRPSAMWAIDTHVNPQRLISRARHVDHVFAAQRDGVEILRDGGVNCVGWLPLACDPGVHQQHPLAKDLDVCFVGHLWTEERRVLAERVRERFGRSFVGQRFFGEMAQTYSQSRIVLNLSVRNDVNMRVFEALACGSMLLTNDLSDNGQDRLFKDGEHLVTYRGLDELFDKAEHYLQDEAARERIAAAGRAEVLARHTYVHRMKLILDAVSAQSVEHLLPAIHSTNTAVQMPAPPAALTSILIVAHNALEFTKRCLESVERCTTGPYEVIVVDNGSTDGTRRYLREESSARLIENAENRGFPVAANQAIRASRGENLLLLNNDVIVTPGWLDRMLAALDSADDVGLVGPCSNEVSGPQLIKADYRDPAGLDRFAELRAAQCAGEVEPVDRLVGFCLLLRRRVVDLIGLLDERFGIGNFEDDDYCRRARLAGFRALIARDCFVHHFGSATFKSVNADYGAILEHNQKLFAEKWESLPEAAPGEAATAPQPDDAEDSIFVAAREPIVSLCMIVRDSARTLRDCLRSAQPWVDEILVVDTGSKDQTPDIARQLGAQVRHFPWCDDFSAARNESLKGARGKWLFWMDSDDTIDPENGCRLRELVCRDHSPKTLAFVMQVRCPAGRESGPYATPTVVDHVKIFRNHPGIRFSGRIHEQLLPSIRQLGGDVEWTELSVCHSGSDASPEGRARKQERDLRILQKELCDDPDHTFTLFNLGMTLLDMARPAEALDALCRSLQLSCPGDSHLRKVYALLAQCYTELGRRPTALRTCMQGLEACPGDAELLFRAAALQQTMGRLDGAERFFRMVIDAKRDRHFSSVDNGILGIKAWHNLAVLYESAGKFDLSADAWRHVLEFDRANPLAWRGLLESATAGKDASLLRQLAGGQVADAPRETRAIAAARVEALGGNPAVAVSQLEQLFAARPSVDVLQEMCELAFRSDLLDVAERGLIELTRLCPDDPAACHNRGTVHLRRKDYAQAARWARRSLQLRPGYEPCKQLLESAIGLAQTASELSGEADCPGRTPLQLPDQRPVLCSSDDPRI